MNRAFPRLALIVLLFLLALPVAQGAAADDAKPGGETGFPGTWAITAAKDDVVRKVKSAPWGGLPGGGSGMDTVRGFDLPLEVMTDARRLVVTDDGKTIRVTYPSGRKRSFVTDGLERHIDDGDGPANVVARRKGETVTVASEWLRGYKLRETWEVTANPRRLVVTGKLRGRESQEYVRTYEPGPALEPTAVPAASPADPGTPPPTPGEPAPGVEQPPPAVDRLGECTIRPPRNARAGELELLVRVTQEEASKVAIASVAPARPTDVISSDVEAFEGCLAWPFTLRLPGRKGVQEVFVDAGDGKVVRSEFVPMDAP